MMVLLRMEARGGKGCQSLDPGEGSDDGIRRSANEGSEREKARMMLKD